MKIGIIDADLLDNGTRHPNLALMKISGYYKNSNLPFIQQKASFVTTEHSEKKKIPWQALDIFTQTHFSFL